MEREGEGEKREGLQIAKRVAGSAMDDCLCVAQSQLTSAPYV